MKLYRILIFTLCIVGAAGVNAQNHSTYLPFQSGVEVTLRGAHGKYLVAEQGGGSEVNANRSVPLSWERFYLATDDGRCVSGNTRIFIVTYPISALSNYEFWGLGIRNDGELWGNFNFSSPDDLSRMSFKIINHSRSNSQCVQSGDTLSFASLHASVVVDGVRRYRHIVAEKNGDANVNRLRIGSWEKFKVNFVGSPYVYF